ncbi:MAG: EAL domain-containing protein [Methylohalobius sp.]|nr:EAL domain-containing protein [Methylohalobius sp.]
MWSRWLQTLRARYAKGRAGQDELLFSALVEAAPDCIEVLNPDGTRRFINRAGLAMLGASDFSQIAARPVWEFIAPADRTRAKAWIEQILRGKPGPTIELNLVGLDGVSRQVESRGVPLLDRSGKIKGALIFTRDLSEHHRVRRDFAKISRLYRTLSQINQLILRRPGRKVLLERTLKILLEEGGFALVFFALSDASNQIKHTLLLAAEPGAEATRLGKTLASLVQRALDQNRPWVANTQKALDEMGLRPEVNRCRIGAMALLPVRVRDRAVGALAVCAQEPGFFEAEHLSLLEELCADIGYALEFEAITLERKLQEKELEFLAYHDPLTSLPNRRRLLEHLAQAVAHARRQGVGFALVLLDLDRFKDVNDCFGHSAGDRLLVQVATHLHGQLRATDLLARLGGDEFALVLDDLHTPEDAGRVAAKLIDSLERSWQIGEEIEVRVGASCGIALYPDHGSEASALLQHADAALYQAKAQGRGQFCYFSPELTARTRHRLHVANQLRWALNGNELALYFQAQLDKDGNLVGAEALVRWPSPSRLIPPAEFIPIAEQSGLIAELDLWVIAALCRQGQAWLNAGLAVPLLAANLSPKELSRCRLDQAVTKILETTGFPPQLLALELTETALMEQGQQANEALAALRQLGVSLALDDFGTGYSSLAQLKRLPLDLIKIDKCFVDDLPQLREDCEIASAIIAMGHALGIKVLAEGVETQSQFRFLADQGCDFYQGYLFSQPLPAEEFAKRWLFPDSPQQDPTHSSQDQSHRPCLPWPQEHAG